MANTFIIAEVAQAHEGSLGIAHSYIDSAAAAGADAIKFQTHIADAESSVHEPFRVKFSYQDATRMDYWRRMEFTPEQWAGLKQHCDEKSIEFMSSPFSIAAVELLEKLDMKRYKIASGEVTNNLMLDVIGRLKKPVILSSGMSSFDELDAAVARLRKHHNNLSVLQCTTSYPTPAEKLGLNVLAQLKERYKCPVGLSDHSGRIEAGIAAVCRGASILEAHIVYDKTMFGPDAKSSLTVADFKALVDGVRFVEAALSADVNKNDNSAYKDVKSIFEKSLAVRKDLPAGHTLSIDDLETKKPAGYGIPARDYENILGRKLKKSLAQYDFLTQDCVE